VGLFAHVSFNPPEKGRALVSAFLCSIWTCSSLVADNIQSRKITAYFANNGVAAREFRYEAGAGNMSINIGAVALSG
jgi:acyl CoA:acetate/3-ketoacid CoA transferase